MGSRRKLRASKRGAGDAVAGAADRLSRVIVRLRMDDDGESIIIEERKGTVLRRAGFARVETDARLENFSDGAPFRIGVNIRKVAALRAALMRESMLAFVRIEMRARTLEPFRRIRTIANHVEVNGVPARRQFVDQDTHEHAVPALFEGDSPDILAVDVHDFGADLRPAGFDESLSGRRGRIALPDAPACDRANAQSRHPDMPFGARHECFPSIRGHHSNPVSRAAGERQSRELRRTCRA